MTRTPTIRTAQLNAEVECFACDGTGWSKVTREKCRVCDGKGKIKG
jgi:DnaJ-class molecular chaperone